MKNVFSQIVVFLLTAAVLSAADFEIRVESSSKTGLVRAGEKVQVRAAAFLDGAPIPPGFKMGVTHWKDGEPMRQETVPAEQGYTATLSLEKPGWSYVTFLLRDPKNRNARIVLKNKWARPRGSGIILEPEKITSVRPEPVDFDAFWASCKAELEKTPLSVLEKDPVPISASLDKRFACYDMKLACAGPKPVSGYLCVPKDKTKKYPVVLCVDGAGVRSSYKSAYPDAVTFSINAHGILNGQPAGYYTDLQKTVLNGYPRSGADSRETIYFKYMFLRVLRALEFLRSLPEWNGRDVIVRGGSQGGAQTLFAAAMDKSVTLAIASVPAMCDFSACLAVPRRYSGWPRPYGPGEKEAAKRTAWDYYDCVNFARRITCPVYVSTGLIDTTCSPSSVSCMFNRLASKEKHIEFHRDMGHVGKNDAGQAAFSEVLRKAAKKDK